MIIPRETFYVGLMSHFSKLLNKVFNLTINETYCIFEFSILHNCSHIKSKYNIVKHNYANKDFLPFWRFVQLKINVSKKHINFKYMYYKT